MLSGFTSHFIQTAKTSCTREHDLKTRNVFKPVSKYCKHCTLQVDTNTKCFKLDRSGQLRPWL